MAAIEVRNLHKGFGRNKVLKDLTFKVGEGEYVVVLGMSGCGKTTLLKTIAGLYPPDSGVILINGADVTAKPPEERNIGFFFQNYCLFPHLTVGDNVGYGLRMRGVPEDEVESEIREKLKLVGLSDWAGHMPWELSGGMQQRAALARALALGSKIMLLDEPLNALDAKIAAILRQELKKMAKELNLTVLHVTPNQEEAMELADRIILMRNGVIVQAGTDVESYTRPNSTYAAYFLGESNFLKGRRMDSHQVEYRHTLFNVSDDVGENDVILAIRSEKVRFEKHERNTLEGVVETINFLGNTTRYEVNHKGRHLHVTTSKYPDLRVGDCVSIYLPPEDLMVFPGSQPPDDEITVI